MREDFSATALYFKFVKFGLKIHNFEELNSSSRLKTLLYNKIGATLTDRWRSF